MHQLYGLGVESVTTVSAVILQSVMRDQFGSVAGNCLIHAGHVGSLFWGRLSGAGENADWALVGASGLGIAGSILVVLQEPNSRIAGQVCVGLDTGIVIGHGMWAFQELAK